MVVGIFGPTASGKTDVAETLADRVGGELVSADAMQLYRGLPILTNKSPRATRVVETRSSPESACSSASFRRWLSSSASTVSGAMRTMVPSTE